MLRIFFLLFLTIPLIEIYLLIQVGSVLGALPTVGLIVLTAMMGAALLRWQGMATLQRVRQTLARGELPAMALFEGAVLLFCGALLLTPGFFTDIIGFIGLIPLLRRTVILWLLSKGLIRGDVGARTERRPAAEEDKRSGGRTIEGQFWREDD